MHTDRLRIDTFSYDDISFIRELTNSPGWLEHIGDRNINSDRDAIKYLETGPLSSYKVHGFGLMRVVLSSSNQPIGMSGFLKRDQLAYPDLGFAFLPEFQGKGYAFEASKALLDWASKNLKSNYVLAITSQTNQRSIKLLDKLGFEEIHPVTINNQPLKQFQFQFDRP
jgi:RimJ/RimL family protein N-acetyltransferase